MGRDFTEIPLSLALGRGGAEFSPENLTPWNKRGREMMMKSLKEMRKTTNS